MKKSLKKTALRKIKDEHLYALLLVLGIMLIGVSVFFFCLYHDIERDLAENSQTIGFLGFFGALDVIISVFISAVMFILGMCCAVCGVQLTILSGAMLYALKKKTLRSYKIVRGVSIFLMVLTAAAAVIYSVKLLLGGNKSTVLYVVIGVSLGLRIPFRFLSISGERLAAESFSSQVNDGMEAEIERK